MNKKIYSILAGVLCSFSAMAQTDSLSSFTDEVMIDLGRNVSYNAKQVTGAISVAGSEQLSHKNSINPSNQLFGQLNGLQVLQKTGAAWEEIGRAHV